MTKDTGYVALSYMTGVIPIAKYSSGSTINNFDEYTMAVQPKFSEYFGFTEKEVDMLYDRYLKRTASPAVTREELRIMKKRIQKKHVLVLSPQTLIP